MYTAADMDSTVHFIEFFMHFVQDVSYGTREVTLSSGESVTFQSAVQKVNNALIIRETSKIFDFQY